MNENTTTPHERRIWVLFGIGIVGLIISLIDTHHYYELHQGIAGFKSYCNLGGTLNCNAVAMSDYASVFGIPLSSLAAGWFLTLAALSYLARTTFWFRDAVRMLFVLSTISVIASGFYAYIMVAKIQYYCLTCFTIDALNLIAWILIFTLKPEPLSRAKPEFQQIKAMSMATLGAFVVTTLGGMIFLSQKGMSSSDLEMYAQSILNTPAVTIDIPADAPVIGPANAKVTIVKFSDFQCPACKMGAFLLHPVLEKYKDSVRFVFINFPLDQKCNRHIQTDMHPQACDAAKIAYCANKMGKFKEVYELFFEEQDTMKSVPPFQTALRSGLNEAELKACFGSPETEKAVIRDIEIATKHKVEFTPTFFINGKKVDGAMPPDVWSKVIEQML